MGKYIRDELQDTYGILQLQDKILEIMVYIDEFCKEHGITYYLMGGSALGAIRHNGFIPWDDDLDIFMDHENYCKFLNLCEEHLDKKRFYLQREDTEELPYFFSKLRMNDTLCIDSVRPKSKKINPHQGIFVDIMCLNKAAKGKFGKKVQYYAAGLLKARSVGKTTYKANSFKKKVQICIANCAVWGPVKKFLLYIVRKYNKKSSTEYAHIFGRAKFENSFYPIEDFNGQRYVPFEKVNLAVPNGVENYLTIRYGSNYMDMPDEKTKAIYKGHAMIWDVGIDKEDVLQKNLVE